MWTGRGERTTRESWLQGACSPDSQISTLPSVTRSTPAHFWNWICDCEIVLNGEANCLICSDGDARWEQATWVFKIISGRWSFDYKLLVSFIFSFHKMFNNRPFSDLTLTINVPARLILVTTPMFALDQLIFTFSEYRLLSSPSRTPDIDQL